MPLPKLSPEPSGKLQKHEIGSLTRKPLHFLNFANMETFCAGFDFCAEKN